MNVYVLMGRSGNAHEFLISVHAELSDATDYCGAIEWSEQRSDTWHGRDMLGNLLYTVRAKPLLGTEEFRG